VQSSRSSAVIITDGLKNAKGSTLGSVAAEDASDEDKDPRQTNADADRQHDHRHPKTESGYHHHEAENEHCRVSDDVLPVSPGRW